MSQLKFKDYQKQALDDLFNLDRVAFYWDMGTGKTFVGAEKLWQLNTPYNLVVCQKSKCEDWKEHIETFYPEYDVIIWDKQKELPDENSIIIINYDRAWRRPILSDLRDFTLLLDESQHIKNPLSKRSKFILKLKPQSVILLSGTPTAGKYEELVTQVNLLGWKISQDTFYRLYTEREWDEVNGGYELVDYKNVDRLKRKLHKYGARFLKTDEVLDLPKQNELIVNVRNTRDYKEFSEHHILIKEDEEIVGDTMASKLTHMRQFAGWRNKYKLEKVKDLIESTNDRIIVFYNFKKEYEAIKELTDRPISTVNGDQKDLSAYEEHNNSLTLIQYQAGATGLNLQKANKVIYFTLPQSSELFEQSKKRVHRIGQEKPCFYYYLLVEGSIEWRMKAALKEKKDYSDELFKKEELE